MGDPNIFLFVPNLIGYTRVILAIVSLYYMPIDPLIASILYLLSGLLDAFDGYAARALDQGTMFGAVLDMVTDRCATTCLLMVLCQFYPKYAIVFQLLVALDISSHWIQMYSSMIHGETSHKVTDLSANPFLRFYYMRPVLFTFCASNELFFAALYLIHFSYGPVMLGYGLWILLAVVSFPLSFLKQLISVIQLVAACRNLGSLDVAKRNRPK
ncbi:hypothetical protein EMCRGX_G024019 [Ephydatia muelleri]|eukprot:Em0015g251a